MKMKSFVMLAMAGLLAAPVCYIAPSIAADDSNVGQLQNPSDVGQLQNPSDVGMQRPSDINMQPTEGMNTHSSSDIGSPDTATGDDDY